MNSTDETYRELMHTINPLRFFEKTYQIESVIRLVQKIKKAVSKAEINNTSDNNIVDFELDDDVKSFEEAQWQLLSESKGEPLEQSINSLSNRGKIADSGEKIIICDSADPNNYIIVSAKKRLNTENNLNYIETEFKVYNNNVLQHCKEFKHGRFIHNSHRNGENTSKAGERHWSSMRAEMQEKCGFSENSIIFKKEHNFNKYKDLFNNREKLRKDTIIADIKNNPPQFTGQHTDIANIIAYDNLMEIGVVESIKDINIQNNTKNVFIKAQENGLITIDVKADKISLTQKGKEHIIKPEFVEQYKRHQIGSIVDTLSDDKTSKIYVELNGSSDDLQIFKFENGLDLSTLPNTESGKNVVENFKNMEKQGYVDIKDNIATPTKKGAKHVTSQPFTLNSQVINTSNIENITANMMKQQTAQAVANTTVKAGSKAASASGVGVIITVAVEVADKLQQVAKEFNSQKRTL